MACEEGTLADSPGWEREPYRRQLDTHVVQWGGPHDQPWVILADTVLYPGGGGQPADRGWVGNVPVKVVRSTPQGVVHEMAGPVALGAVRVRLDWERRFDHMQQHTAQHLLTALAQDRFGWVTTAFHLGEHASDIELNVPALDESQLGEVEEAVAAEIRAARPVRCRRVRAEEVPALPVRTRGLPPGHSGHIRLIEIEGVDLNPCGGTHVANTAELESLAFLATESMRGGTRLYFAAGGRVRRLLHQHLHLAAKLRAALGASNSELVAVARAKLQAMKELERTARRLGEEAAASLGEALAARGGALISHHLAGKDLSFLQRAARRCIELAPASLVLLTCDGDGEGLFCLAAGPQVQVDAAVLADRCAALLGGRAGGKGCLYQGKAPSLSQRQACLDLIRRLLDTPAAL